MGRKPQLWLKDGDVCEVGLDDVGVIVNKIEFSQAKPKI